MKTVIGNWKMEVGTRESIALARGALLSVRGKRVIPELIICPPFTALSEVRKVVARSSVSLGAQDMFWEDSGAYTGEVSPRMLEEHGVSHVILGHSERRQILGEIDEMINKKADTALGHGLTPIICIGETKEQRDAGEAQSVVENQVRAVLKDLVLKGKDEIMLAYEPIWAIGSGESAQATDAIEMHKVIRRIVNDVMGEGAKVKILYGGSVNDENAYSFLRESEIDGVLVGGASVKMSQFTKIVDAAADVMEGMNS